VELDIEILALGGTNTQTSKETTPKVKKLF